MRIRVQFILALLGFGLAAPALADDSGSFIVRLGQDTIGVEHYTRTATHVEVDQIGRAPRVTRRHITYDVANGAVSKLSMVATAPGSAGPTQTIAANAEGDSLRVQTQAGSAPPQKSSIALPPGSLVVASSSPWSGYEGVIMRLIREKRDSLRTNMFILGFPAPDWLSLHRLGPDSVSIFNGHMDQFHARVDKAGHILGVLPIAGTGKVSVERVATLDLESMAASFAAREQAGAGLGMLSPRDTVKVANAGGASLWIDYGRPGKRGRVVFGGVVPFGEVWRTGANAATQFKVDKTLVLGGTEVPAGFYTLWTIPAPGGWKLLINGETGQWGTAHKGDKDLYTVDMEVKALPQVVERFTIGVETSAQGGVLNFDWDQTRASVPFTVKP